MAKRRKLEAPDAAELAALEEGFAAKPVPDRLGIGAPPIAAVAAETARLSDPHESEHRVKAARDASDAGAWREAREAGRIIEDLPVDAVIVEHMVRDRLTVSAQEMEELKTSIRANGQRLPIEVVVLARGRYGLVSGWRRLEAIRSLAAESGQVGRVRALVRPAGEAGAAYAAMVEENEVRSQITPYERGRIAVVAAEQGAFRSPEEAVDAIFATASKAKRSKIRSFALLHEELGDMLVFPTEISERNGLRLAQAIRAGFGPDLREALGTGLGIDPAREMAALEPVLGQAERSSAGDRPSGGRPTRQEPPIVLDQGLSLQRLSHGDGFSLRFRGSAADADLSDRLMREVARLFGE